MTIVHRWSDYVAHSIYGFECLLKKLDLGEFATECVGYRSHGDMFHMVANAGVELIFTGYDDGWYQFYDGNCKGECCHAYNPDVIQASVEAIKALDEKEQRILHKASL
jgi:hypothetical protein